MSRLLRPLLRLAVALAAACGDGARDPAQTIGGVSADAATSGTQAPAEAGAAGNAAANPPAAGRDAGEVGVAPSADSGGAAALGGTAVGADAGAADGGSRAPLDASMEGGAQPIASKRLETEISAAGLTVVSYGGYLNGESFQQDGILTYRDYQYAALWNTSRHVVLARRRLPDGAWSRLEFNDYTNTADDAHNTISLGVSPGDGTLHMAFDHHGNDLHYRKSTAGWLDSTDAASWSTASFSPVTSALVGSTKIALVTYPRFITEPGGKKLLFGVRLGTSGSGDEHLWEYDSESRSWSALGKYLDGISDSVNAYPHGLSYTRGGTRLHISWCWRETPDASTNHDLFYAYSDDHGRSWKSNAGATIASTGTRFIRKNTAAAKVFTIAQNRGLINQEHMTVGADGTVHVLLSHMPDGQPDDADFNRARAKSQFFHYFRSADGSWARRAIGLTAIATFRGKLAVSSTHNVYAILPDLRIAGAAKAANYERWTLLDGTSMGRYFSDPLIDTARLESADELTIFYPRKGSGSISALDYTIR